MHSLWFKAIYVQPILEGGKTDTIRAKPPRFTVGDTVSASVGPTRSFAALLITNIEAVTLDELDDTRRAEVLALYSNAEQLHCITFRVLKLH